MDFPLVVSNLDHAAAFRARQFGGAGDQYRHHAALFEYIGSAGTGRSRIGNRQHAGMELHFE